MPLTENAVVQVLLRERVRLTAAAQVVLRDSHAAEDVYQQVVVQALEARDRIGDATHLLAWSLRAVRHRALDIVRARKAVCLDDDVLQLLERGWAADGDDAVHGRLAALGHCLDKLPEHARSLLRLRYGDGLSCGAVAERVGRTVNAVYQTLSRLHRSLKGCVETRLRVGT
jgi:RNA polymerase sigma-70 factor (ECF subfamily)